MTRQNGNVAKYAVIGFFGLGAVLLAWNGLRPASERGGTAAAIVVPQLSPAAVNGKAAFDANCASCHGPNASGTDKGPPLVHDIYNPGHHADESFVLAAKLGVRRHHWRFGDMPPQRQTTEEQVRSIITYVRELQVANGITYRPHRM